jgi:pimeloyl-ACP methyl ester carboxylesterase
VGGTAALDHIEVDGVRIEYMRIEGSDAAPTLVFLHEGLGSLSMWRDFPQRVAAATLCPAVVYSRAGYGKSSPLAAARAPDYMHAEALTVLPALLDALAIERPLLIGHSDGASIALIHAGAAQRPVRGVVALAPHVFVEALSIESIARARENYAAGDLRARLARYHQDVDSVFRGWNDIWLSPRFRDWNIEDVLPAIECPVLLIQGRDDEYGTLAQLDAIEAGVRGDVERIVLDECGHSPQRDQPEVTLSAILRFVTTLARARP